MLGYRLLGLRPKREKTKSTIVDNDSHDLIGTDPVEFPAAIPARWENKSTPVHGPRFTDPFPLTRPRNGDVAEEGVR